MNLPSWSEKWGLARRGQYVGFSQLPGGGAGPWGSGGWVFLGAGLLIDRNALPLQLLDLLPRCCTQQTILDVGGHIVRGLPLPHIVRDVRRTSQDAKVDL